MLKFQLVLISFFLKGRFNFENEKERAQDVKEKKVVNPSSNKDTIIN